MLSTGIDIFSLEELRSMYIYIRFNCNMCSVFCLQKRLFIRPYMNPNDPIEFSLLLHQVWIMHPLYYVHLAGTSCKAVLHVFLSLSGC